MRLYLLSLIVSPKVRAQCDSPCRKSLRCSYLSFASQTRKQTLSSSRTMRLSRAQSTSSTPMDNKLLPPIQTCARAPPLSAVARLDNQAGRRPALCVRTQADTCRCCPNSYTCSSPANANGMIGCCPAGSSCGGAINVASVSTITVQAQQQTAIVYAQPPATTSVVYTQSTQDVHQQGFCSTLTAAGPGLPTTRQGDCGVILVVSEGTINLKALGYGTGVVFVLLHLALKRMFSWA